MAACVAELVRSGLQPGDLIRVRGQITSRRKLGKQLIFFDICQPLAADGSASQCRYWRSAAPSSHFGKAFE